MAPGVFVIVTTNLPAVREEMAYLSMGCLLYTSGIVLGLIAKYDIKDSLNLGMSMAGVMFLMPRMVRILMEGLIPVSEAAKKFMQKRFAGNEFYIGLDSAVAIGHPSAIATALILVPITILLALIVPGNRVLPRCV